MRPGGASVPKLTLVGFRVSSWDLLFLGRGTGRAPNENASYFPRSAQGDPRSPRLVLAQGSGWELGWAERSG